MGIELALQSPLAEAVRKAGSQSAFGRMIGRSQSTVFDWLREGRDLPGEHVLVAEAATGVSRHLLNPTVFGPAGSPAYPSGSPKDPVEPGGAIVLCDRAAPLQDSDT